MKYEEGMRVIVISTRRRGIITKIDGDSIYFLPDGQALASTCYKKEDIEIAPADEQTKEFIGLEDKDAES